MKEIIINSKTYGQKTVFVDDEDFELVMQHKWHLQPAGSKLKKIFYAVSCKYISKIKGHTINEIISMTDLITKRPKEMVVDHKDGNTLNNQKYNLRICTQLDNSRNKGLSADNKSGYNGVCKVFNTTNKVWQTRIIVNRKEINGGFFETKEAAALRYNELALEHFGEFARLNVIKND